MAAKILIFEMLPLMRDVLRSLLSAQPDMEVVAATGEIHKAIALARSQRPDVVLVGTTRLGLSTDVIRGVTEEQGRTSSAPHCLAFYQELSNGVVAELLQAGARGLLNRDADGEEVVAAAREIAKGRTVVTCEVAQYLVEWFREYAQASPVNAVPETRALTDREREVLALIGRGLSIGELAGALHISVSTVRTHLHRIRHKLDLRDRAQLVAFAYRSGLVHTSAAR
jgi:DNA-binding NarL/FixJ family response regulator